ncbi:hypothetical protein V8C37DRAFT_400902 [Trichoderma ceciliae]
MAVALVLDYQCSDHNYLYLHLLNATVDHHHHQHHTHAQINTITIITMAAFATSFDASISMVDFARSGYNIVSRPSTGPGSGSGSGSTSSSNGRRPDARDN